MKTNNKGFATVELVALIGILVQLFILGLIVYAVVHFVAKFW